MGAPLVASASPFSDYELELVEEELAERGLTLDSAPEGKLVSSIELVRFEVFDERDPVPDFINVFHVTSRERVIRRELSFAEGQPWVQSRVDETARNLKSLRQLSLVAIVPAADPERPGHVRVLVLTKDVWSLRLNSDFEVAGRRLNSLVLSPAEENLFGTHARVAGYFTLQRDSYSVGGSVAHDRIPASRLAGVVSYSAVLNRDSGDYEGFVASFSYGIPLTSITQKWAFASSFVARDYLVREYARDGTIAEYDAEATPAVERIPYEYAYERYVAENQITRSFGRRHKLDLGFGVEADRKVFRAPRRAGVAPLALAEFASRVLPRSDTRISPFVQLDSYESRFLKTSDLDTLGLTEDVRLGHRAIARVYPAARRAGSSRDLFGVYSGLSYTLALRDGVARAMAISEVEYAAPGERNGRGALAAYVASPRLGAGRLIADALVQNRYANYSNQRYELGGDDRLRGYPTDDPTLRGDDAVAANLEFRSAGVNILSVECGAVAFYDAGGTADRLSDIDFRHSVGLGLRFMAPEFDRVVLRADWGFPLSAGYSTFPGGLFVTFGQALVIPALAPPSVVRDAL